MDLKKWQLFFDSINANFFDFEQERYLLERSMELSSAEFLEINNQFEQAESIAHIGHWSYWPEKDRRIWSKEVYKIFGINEATALPGKSGFLEFFYEEDKSRFQKVHELALMAGEPYEIEARIYFQSDHSVRWILAKAQPTLIQSVQNVEQDYKYNLSGIVMDIDSRKHSEEELKELNGRLIALSRQVGMSEVAASVLHNIGNILNSTNVSIVMLRELLSNNQISKLETISTMLQEGVSKNPEYLLSDDKGKLIPSYLSQLSQSLVKKQDEMINEIDKLNTHIDHIKDIVLMQSEISGISAIKEKISVEEICNQALQMSYGLEENNTIKIKRQFEFKDVIFVDKTKMLQILVNLIRNAKDALMLREIVGEKIIKLLVRECKKGIIEIQISDNGVGIQQKYLKKIFSMGFTTKSHGHGFGLHMSAIAAKEMGGELTVTSDGENQGATFTLTFPIKYNDGMNIYGH